MTGTMKKLMFPLVLTLLVTIGCAPDYTPVEPAANTGTKFQRPLETMQTATRNALTKLNFAIVKDEGTYFEAVHLKPGETVENNSSELVGVWLKQGQGSIVLLIDTVKRASGIKYQKEWDQELLRKIMQELRVL